MSIDENNPLNFSPKVYPAGTPVWGQAQLGKQGAYATDHELQAGVSNTGDNQGSPSPTTWDTTNGGNSTSSDSNGDPTIINTAVAYNSTFAADNIYTGPGSVGLYGRSRGMVWSIGVLGQSHNGCAIYGIATDLNPTPLPSPNGIGVVGRSMGGVAMEQIPVEQVMNEPIGVLGHCESNGPGVLGHGGPLLLLTFAGPVPLLPAPVQPGGVFSSGQRQFQPILGASATAEQIVSLTPAPQLRLTSSVGATLPSSGAQIGDMFLQLQKVTTQTQTGELLEHVAQLWICTRFIGNTPQWQSVEMGPVAVGGTAAPPPLPPL
jgi:hypothetical protein